MPQTEDNPTPPFPAYRVTVDGVGLYITGHEGGYNVVYPDGRYETITAEYPDRAHAASDLTGKVHAIPVPQEVTRPRFIIALRKVLNITEGDIFALISAMPPGELQEDARDLWENARVFKRTNRFLLAIAQIEGVTEAQVDDVFRVGASLDLD